ncbi:MAG: M50 family metallopeptidase [Candidatus Woesebacteria bacterium]
MGTLIFIIGIIMFVGLVVLHELGHAIVARRNGVELEEFGIGFPPKAWSKKTKKGTIISINWLPLGGFVRLKGEHDAAIEKGSYGAASLWSKTKILLAGVAVNWLVAALIFTILAFVGMPQVVEDQFTVPNDTIYAKNDVIAGAVVKDSPAEKAGIRTGDILLSLNGHTIENAQSLSELTQSFAGKTVPILVSTNSQTQNLQITLNSERIDGQGYSGIGPAEDISRRSTWSAPIVGVGVTAQFTWVTLDGLAKTIAQLFKADFAGAGQNVAGPVGIFSILQQSSEAGFVPVLFLIGIISLTLAVMNILPIPALDGGRLFVTLIFRALKKPLTKEREESIQAAGFMTLMGLIVLITIVDVGRIIG